MARKKKPETTPVEKDKGGRPSGYTPEIHQQIVETLESGVSIRDCCAFVGISQATYYEWGKKFPEFSEATLRARVKARVGAAQVVQRSALGDPSKSVPPNVEDAKWYLERTDPANWGRKDMLVGMHLNPQQLRELKAIADSHGIDLAVIFEEMINQFASVERPEDRSGNH